MGRLEAYAQTAQTAACNRHHTMDQQLYRWLLRSLDRVDSNELAMTQAHCQYVGC